MLHGNVIGITCSGLSLILHLTGILSDYWLVNFGRFSYHQGIWQRCSRNMCAKITAGAYLDATRGLLVLSTALIVFAVLLSCLTFFKQRLGKVSTPLATGITEALAAIFLIIGMVVYTSKTADIVLKSSFNFQWSFYLCWTAGFTLIAAVISHIMAHKASPIPGYDSV